MSETKEQALRAEALACLTENILPFWLERMADHERGGWYGQMTGRGVLVKEAPRGAVLYARLLWTFSAAYRVLGTVEEQNAIDREALLAAARRTKDYVERCFLDREYGGAFWSVTADGQPADAKKQFYALGFMVYGFSEYARATGDDGALRTALQLYEVIEHHGWDAQYGGYIEACRRDWQPIADLRLSEKDENQPKSQNTHLHILEPYTNLLRALREAIGRDEASSGGGGEWNRFLCENVQRLKVSITRLIDIFTEKILNPHTHHLDLFFALDWTRTSSLSSYGHDIECSWLIHEAALVLGNKELLGRVEPVVRDVARASEEGLQADGSMIYETFDADRHWWVQAETVVGFLNLYQHFGDRRALEIAQRCWRYIKANLIDEELGEWYWSRRADGSLNLDDDHAGFWKCPYHNSRMCLEILERLRRNEK